MKIHEFLCTEWTEILQKEFQKDYFKKLIAFLEKEIKSEIVLPPTKDIFSAFNITKPEDVKVVILGQDPYHGIGQAHGLCFSIKQNVKIPPSLRNIFKELESDIGSTVPNHGNLESWAKQGVFLLNTTLTVRKSQAASHQKKGWEEFTDAVITYLSREKKNLIFMLWGKQAQKKSNLIDPSKHSILTANHPSPLSAHRGFFGCKHFSLANAIIEKHGGKPIQWEIP